ncbi:speriolin-like protein [Gadus morhua]|uniref:Speriolin C-terminal domain-containing protein n=1 Tax=Gadus morhua TaxID=8049 RepID=A0A8C4Z7D7_GADMO|nr:speriolin-like protein [Gadus morhua]
MASMDFEQANVTLLSENENLKHSNNHLNMVLNLVKESLELTTKNNVSSWGVHMDPEGSKPTTHIQDTLGKSQFRRNLHQRGLKPVHKTSSPISFESFIKSSMHTQTRVKPAVETYSQSSVPRKVKDPERLIGEIAFQLDRRILSHVFQSQARLYGFTVLNIPEKIIQVSSHPLIGRVDEGYGLHVSQRYTDLMGRLAQLGYNRTLHPPFTEFIVNTYGILKQRPDSYTAQKMDYNNVYVLREVIFSTAPGKLVPDLLLLLSCLSDMARTDRKPLLLW